MLSSLRSQVLILKELKSRSLAWAMPAP